MSKFITILEGLDRRWIFLAMAISVAGPILYIGITGKTLPETQLPQRVLSIKRSKRYRLELPC